MTAADRHLHEAEAHQLTIRGLESSASTIEDIRNSSTEDYVFNYYSKFLKMGLLKRNFQDAVSEMDGERLLRLWKFKLLYFKEAGRTNARFSIWDGELCVTS